MPLITSDPIFHLPYLIISVVYSEIAHTNNDFMEQSLTGMLGAVPQQRADNMPECEGQAFGTHNRLERRSRNRSYRLAACYRNCVKYMDIHHTQLLVFAKYRLCSLL